MKERIIEALKKVHRALNYEEMDSLLNNRTIEETKEMNESLEELEEEGEIYHSNKGKYMLFSDRPSQYLESFVNIIAKQESTFFS